MYIRKIILSAFTAIFILTMLQAQTPVLAGQRIDMTHILMNEIELPERNRALAASGLSFADTNPEEKALEKKLGQKDPFFVKNVTSGQFEQITAILRAVGKHCYVYVAEDQSVSQAAVSKVQSKFDQTIYPINTGSFGNEWKPGIDGDNRVYLLLSDIKDGYQNPTDGYVAGYFFAGDEMMQAEFPSHSKVRSNEKEIIYLDTYPCDPEAKDYMEIVAHEFQHMIHYNQDNKESTWVNEGCSQIAPVLCGFTAPGHFKLLKDAPDRSLNNWAQWDPMPDYGQVYLWNQYLLEVFTRQKIKPATFYRSLTKSKKASLSGFIEAFAGIGLGLTDTFTDYIITNHVNDARLGDGKYSYQARHLKNYRFKEVKQIFNFPAHEKESVKVWSSDAYLAHIGNVSGNLKVSFSGYRRSIGSTHPYFRFATILQDSTGHHPPKLGFMKLAANPADKNRLIGSLNVKADGTYDRLKCIIIALAPEDVEDKDYMPASGFIYDLRIETNAPFAASNAASDLTMMQFVKKISSAADMPVSENAVRIRENYTHQLVLCIRQDLEKGSFKTVDAFIEAATENDLLSPYARDISGMLRFYLASPESRLSMADLQARIEILDSF